MDHLSTETYESDGKTYELTVAKDETRYQIIVTYNGKELGPRYGVDIASDVEYLISHQQRLLDNLMTIVKSDIDVGMYLGR